LRPFLEKVNAQNKRETMNFNTGNLMTYIPHLSITRSAALAVGACLNSN
jgi:hypothetical protein